jgi:hypothetical protein
MSRNGSGTYTLPAGNPVTTGTTISSTWANTTLSDIQNALTQSLASDGQTTATGPLNMGANKVTNMAAATVNGDAVEYSQLVGILVSPTVTGTLTVNGDLAVTGNGSFSGTGYLLIPKGTILQRPAVPVAGEIRYNTDYNVFEGYANGTWGNIGGGATGGGGDQVFVENSTTVTANYTLTTGKNAESVGPITINSTKTVTIPSGQRWVIL